MCIRDSAYQYVGRRPCDGGKSANTKNLLIEHLGDAKASPFLLGFLWTSTHIDNRTTMGLRWMPWMRKRALCPGRSTTTGTGRIGISAVGGNGGTTAFMALPGSAPITAETSLGAEWPGENGLGSRRGFARVWWLSAYF